MLKVVVVTTAMVLTSEAVEAAREALTTAKTVMEKIETTQVEMDAQVPLKKHNLPLMEAVVLALV